MQLMPPYRDVMTYPSPSTREPVSRSFMVPRSKEDLVQMRKHFKLRTDHNFGFMGRAPDFMNAFVTGLNLVRDRFATAGEQFAANAARYYEHVREHDLFLTHMLINPQVDRSKTSAQQEDPFLHLGKVRDTSEGIVVRGELLPRRLDALSQSSAVLWIERAPKRKLVDEAASKLVGGDDGNVATPTVTQQLGFDGTGVTVCVADTGLDSGDTNTMHPDMLGRVAGFQYYGGLTDGSDGYGHGTHCAGIVAGNAATGETDPDTGRFYGLGVASGANLFVERIFDDNAKEVSPFPSDETLTRDAVRHGAKRKTVRC